MQRKREIPAWLLIPFLGVAGAVGAFATGVVSPQWPLNWPLISSGQPAATQARTASDARQPSPSGQAETQPATRSAALPPKDPSAATTANPVTAPAATQPTARPFGIDIARLASGGPGGMSVIAGFAKPLARITVMADGEPVGTTVADDKGDWVLITPHNFTSSDPKLEVRPGDLTAPKLAAAPSAAAQPNSDRPITARPITTRPSAASVTQDMMRRLERLTNEAALTPGSPLSGSSSSATPPSSGAASATAPATEAAASAPQQPATATALASPLGSRPNADPASAAPAPTTPPAAATKPQPASVRETLPVPVQFVYRQSVFTPEGEAAAALLLKYFKARQFEQVALSGHADERGSSSANMQLSRERLERVQRFLQDGGFKGKLTLVPKGSSEAFTGVDRSKFPIEELYQLDRRVEVISAQ